FGGKLRPALGNFDVFLLEDDLAGVVRDFGRATVPFDLVERADLGVTEHPLDGERLALGGGSFFGSWADSAHLLRSCSTAALGGCRRQYFLTCVDHDISPIW